MRKYLLVLFIVIFVVLFVNGVGAEKYYLRFGHVGTEETAFHATAVRFADLTYEFTNGEVKIEIYPNGELGNEIDLFEQVQSGITDFCIAAPGQVVEFSDKFSFLSFPFMFDDRKHWERVITSDIGEEIKKIILDETSVRIIGYIGGGLRNVVSRRPLNELSDFKNFLMRIHPIPITLEMWQSIGVIPTIVAWSEIYNALQLGVIDGLENECEWILLAKFYEQAPYIIKTANDISTRPIFMSDISYKKLPSDIQKNIEKAADEACTFGREVGINNDLKAEKILVEEYGVKMIDINKESLLEKIQPIQNRYAEKLGLLYLLEEVRKLR